MKKIEVENFNFDDFNELEASKKEKFIEKIFKLSSNRFQKFIENNLNDFIYRDTYISLIFTKELFKLENNVLLPIIEKCLNLMESIKFPTPFIFNELFKLSPEILCPFIKKNLDVFIDSNTSIKQFFIKKLFKLNIEDLYPFFVLIISRSINTDDTSMKENLKINFTKLSLENRQSIFDKYILDFLKQNPSQEDVIKLLDIYIILLNDENKLLFQSHWHNMFNQFANFNTEKIILEHSLKNNNIDILEFLPAATTFHDNASSLNPLIYKILFNTRIYTIKNPINKRKFIQNFSEGLQKIIDSSPTIAKILEITCQVKSKIYMDNSKFISFNKNKDNKLESSTQGACNDDLEIILAIENPLSLILQAFVHESTHKFIKMIFNNNFLHFYEETNISNEFKLYKDELKNEIKLRLQKYRVENKNSESWLLDIEHYYIDDDKISEIFPHFIGQITASILNNNNDEAVNYKYALMLWNYIHNHFNLGLNDQELPKLCYYENGDISDQDKLVKEAESIITQPINTAWFDNYAGLLAFKSSVSYQKYLFIKNLLNSKEEFNSFASIYLSPILQNNQHFNINTLYQNLLKLKNGENDTIDEFKTFLGGLSKFLIQEFEQVFEYRLSNHSSEEIYTPLLSYLSINFIDENKFELLASILNKQIIEIKTFTDDKITDHLNIELIIEELLDSPTLTENNNESHLAGEILTGEIETLEAP